MKKGTSKKHLTKRAYVYLALVTMAAISLLAKPIKRGYTALEKHLANASCEEKKANLRRDLKLLSDRRYNEKVNGYVPSEKKDFVDESLEKEIKSLRHQLKNCKYHNHELD